MKKNKKNTPTQSEQKLAGLSQAGPTSIALSEAEALLVRKLREHPQLLEQLGALLEEIGDEHHQLTTADEAEEALVKRLHEMGRLSLTQWAQNKALQSDQGPPEAGSRRGSKKNSIGRAVLAA